MPRKVLVADDSVTIQKVVGITFAAEDVTLSFVDNGDEAIELARQIKPDLIIADVLMPRKSGYEVCEAIKQDPELCHVPVLLLTGTFEPFDAERSRRVGADGTITKPFESHTLIRQVNELLARAAPRAQAQAPTTLAAETPALHASAAEALASSEAESAFADLSRDLELEPLPASAESEPQAPPAAEAPVPQPSVDEAFDFGFESGGDFSFAQSTGAAVEAAPAEPTTASHRLSEREDEFEFVEEPGEVLELGEPSRVTRVEEETPALLERPYGAGEPPAADLFSEARTAESGEVWDLSDMEAVEESAVLEPDRPEEETEPPSFWDDAAAEAIDLVESVSVDAPEEMLLSEDDSLDAELSAAGESMLLAPAVPAPDAIEAEPSRLLEDSDLDLKLTGIDEGSTPSAKTERTEGEPLHPSLEDLPEFDFDASRAGEPLEEIPEIEPSVEPLAPVPFLGEPFLAEPFDSEPSDLAPAAPASGTRKAPDAPPALAAVASLGAETANDAVRRAVNDAVERVTWEAFSDLSETVVKAVKEKVEQIAWEVIPQMAEAMIKEEIKRISDEKK